LALDKNDSRGGAARVGRTASPSAGARRQLGGRLREYHEQDLKDAQLKDSEHKDTHELEHLCDPFSLVGKWIRGIDLLEKGRGSRMEDGTDVAPWLEVRQKPGFQKCEEECRSVEKACKDIIYHSHLGDLDVMQWGSALAEMCRYPCKDGIPRAPKDRVDYPFVPLTADADHLYTLEMTGMEPEADNATNGTGVVMDTEL